MGKVLMQFDDSLSFLPFDMPENIALEPGVLAMSNGEGELLFYTNGNVVVSWDHKIMHGGKGFNEGSTYADFDVDGKDTTYNISYLPFTYRVVPDPYDENTYYLIQPWVIFMGDCPGFDATRMQISKIDMSAHGGRGKVVYKNRIFDEEPMATGQALVRHGNGRDWWFVRRSHDGMTFRSILLHRDSVVQVVTSEILGLGTDWPSWLDCEATSLSDLYPSVDGSMLIDKYGQKAAKLLSFDRCNGEVVLLDTITTGIFPLVYGVGDTLKTAITLYEFSPSGRYLYGASYGEFAQWDLEAPDITASRVRLGGVPWAMHDIDQVVMPGIRGGLSLFAHGPDGKIYNLQRTSHSVIHHPDEPGEASGLCLAADIGIGSCLGPDVPYWLYSNRHPNYRLGALEGSGCDTIISSTKEPLSSVGYSVSASPSPASGQVEVSITLPGYGGSTAEIQLVDMLGRVLHRHRFPPYAYLHILEVGGWPPGLYNVVLLENGRARASARLVVGR